MAAGFLDGCIYNLSNLDRICVCACICIGCIRMCRRLSRRQTVVGISFNAALVFIFVIVFVFVFVFVFVV